MQIDWPDEVIEMGQCMIGVPKEVKPMEGRVSVVPDGARVLVADGHKVCVQENAGVLAGFSDDDYRSAGVAIYEDVEQLYRDADIIVKVKEPTREEYGLLPLLKGKILFAYLHLAGVDPQLTRLLLKHEVTAIAYEAVTEVVGERTILPLLIPMSRIAGVQAMRSALLRYDHNFYHRLEVVLLGGGVVGEAALNQALVNKVGAIAVFESRAERMLELRAKYSGESTVDVFPFTLLDEPKGKEVLKGADIVLSGVMLPGGSAAPKVLTQKHFRCMKRKAYIADVAIDQGGSTAWSKVTKPGETYTRGAKLLTFSCVPNIPGSTVPNEATEALTKVTLPYVCLLGKRLYVLGDIGVYGIFKEQPGLRAGVQTFRGRLLNNCVAKKHGLEEFYSDPDFFF